MTETSKEASGVTPLTLALSAELSTRLQATAFKLKLPFETTVGLACSLLETIVDHRLYEWKGEKIILTIKNGEQSAEIAITFS